MVARQVIFTTQYEIEMEHDYIGVNRALWDKKTGFHVQSAFYDVAGFVKGATSLKEVELGLLGNVSGLRVLHLQCHFGQDTLSLARMGAKVTGVDLSPVAIEKACALNEQLGLDARFICCDVYELDKHLDEQFDMVFTSYGTIGWLPDMDRWAGVVSSFLKPDGRFVFVEFHPVVWMFDNEFKQVAYSYFSDGPIVETLKGTYADRDAPMEAEEIGWNHGMGEVLQSLTGAGLRLEQLQEYSYSPYNCFANMVEAEPGRFQLRGLEGKMPMLYSIVAVKRGVV